MISSVLINTIKIFNPSGSFTDLGLRCKILVASASQLQKELEDSRGKWEVCMEAAESGVGVGEGSESTGGQVSPCVTCPRRLMVVVVVVM